MKTGITQINGLEDLNARLTVDFPESLFPWYDYNTTWNDWVDRVVSTTAFMESSAPPSAFYSDQNEWLAAFIQVLTL